MPPAFITTRASQPLADYPPVPILLLSYVSYLFRLQLLCEDRYLLEWLQSANKTKTHPKAKLQNAPTFTGNRSHCHVCLLLVIKMKTCTYQLCKRQSADANILIGRYRLSADYRCFSTVYNIMLWLNFDISVTSWSGWWEVAPVIQSHWLCTFWPCWLLVSLVCSFSLLMFVYRFMSFR